MNPKNNTRIDFKIKKTAPLENCCGPEDVFFTPIYAELPFQNLPLKIDMQKVQDLN